MPMTGLTPSVLVPNLCCVKYRITTDSPQCQAYFDQGLGYFYSYVWMEAARSFETAAKYDPKCPMAWWGLSRALERWGKSKQNDALKKASELKDRASFREQQLILARLQEKGMAPGVGGGDARKMAAVKTLDTLLAIHDDDEEGWYYRAQLAGGAGLFGRQVSSVPFYKALLQVNPLHPAPIRAPALYETFRRPALGWPCERTSNRRRHPAPFHCSPSGDVWAAGQDRRSIRLPSSSSRNITASALSRAMISSSITTWNSDHLADSRRSLQSCGPHRPTPRSAPSTGPGSGWPWRRVTGPRSR